MSHTRFKADAITNRDITSYGNITGKYILGNGAFLTGLSQASIPAIVSADIRGNVIGNYVNVSNINASAGNVGNVILSGGGIRASGQVNIAGNVIAPFFIGNGRGLTGVLTINTAEIIADIFGNITSSGTITTSGNFYAGSISGDGSNITNIALSSIQPGDLYRDVFGNITGTSGAFSGNVSCATVLASNIQAGNVQGIFNVAYSNLITSPFNLSAQNASNLFIRNGLSTTVMLRTDGVAVVSNGAAYRFGTNDFDKGVLTNGSDGQYGAGTLTGDLIVHNTKTNARTCLASSYGTPELTVFNGNIGIRTTNPNVALDVNGEANVGNLGAISMYLSAPTTFVNIIQVGGSRVGVTNTNAMGLGRDLQGLRINTMTGNTVEFYAGGTRTANISPTGNLFIAGADAIKSTGSTWTNPSDRRLKDNIITANLDDCIQIVRNLDLKSFSWKDNRQNGNVLGWIAQEVEEYLPESITTTGMFGLEDCKILNADQLYVNMYGALKKSIQMIDTLKTKVEVLRVEVDALKAK